MDRLNRGVRSSYSACLTDDAAVVSELLSPAPVAPSAVHANQRTSPSTPSKSKRSPAQATQALRLKPAVGLATLLLSERTDSGCTPLHVAATHGAAAVMRVLLQAAASEGSSRAVHARDVESHWTPLHRAIYHLNMGCALMLIAHGAVLDDVSERALLVRGVRTSSAWTRPALTPPGASASGAGVYDRDGATPLDLAAAQTSAQLATARLRRLQLHDDISRSGCGAGVRRRESRRRSTDSQLSGVAVDAHHAMISRNVADDVIRSTNRDVDAHSSGDSDEGDIAHTDITPRNGSGDEFSVTPRAVLGGAVSPYTRARLGSDVRDGGDTRRPSSRATQRSSRRRRAARDRSSGSRSTHSGSGSDAGDGDLNGGVFTVLARLEAGGSLDDSLPTPDAPRAPAFAHHLQQHDYVVENGAVLPRMAIPGGTAAPNRRAPNIDQAYAVRISSFGDASPRCSRFHVVTFGRHENQLGYVVTRGSEAVQCIPRAVEFPALDTAEGDSCAPFASDAAAAPTAAATRGSPPAFQAVEPLIVSCGAHHCIAVGADGAAYAWGVASGGRLGLGGPSSGIVVTPTLIKGLARIRVVSVSASERHSLAVSADGVAFAWGDSSSGALGINGLDEDAPFVWTPRSVDGALRRHRVVAAAAAPHHSVWLTSDGAAWACGSNAWGQLAQKDIVMLPIASERAAPAAAAATATRTALGAGGKSGTTTATSAKAAYTVWGAPRRMDPLPSDDRRAARTSSSSAALKGWGCAGPDTAGWFGTSELGDASRNRAVAVAVAESYTVLLTANGDVCEVGRGSATWRRLIFDVRSAAHTDNVAAYVKGLPPPESVARRAAQELGAFGFVVDTAALMRDENAPSSWTRQRSGRRYGTSALYSSPAVSPHEPVVGGGTHLPQAGHATPSSGARKLQRASAAIIKISAARHHAVALDEDGQVWCWSARSVLTGTTATPVAEAPPSLMWNSAPVRVAPLSRAGVYVVALSAATHHTLVATRDGSVYGWGDDVATGAGALGNGSGAATIPRRVWSLRAAVDVAAGEHMSAALCATHAAPLPPLLPAVADVASMMAAHVVASADPASYETSAGAAKEALQQLDGATLSARLVDYEGGVLDPAAYASVVEDLLSRARIDAATLVATGQQFLALNDRGDIPASPLCGVDGVDKAAISLDVEWGRAKPVSAIAQDFLPPRDALCTAARSSLVPSLKSMCERVIASYTTLGMAPTVLAWAGDVSAHALASYCGQLLARNADMVFANAASGVLLTSTVATGLPAALVSLVSSPACIDGLVRGSWESLRARRRTYDVANGRQYQVVANYKAIQRVRYELIRPASTWRGMRESRAHRFARNRGADGAYLHDGDKDTVSASLLAGTTHGGKSVGISDGLQRVIAIDAARVRQLLFTHLDGFSRTVRREPKVISRGVVLSSCDVQQTSSSDTERVGASGARMPTTPLTTKPNDSAPSRAPPTPHRLPFNDAYRALVAGHSNAYHARDRARRDSSTFVGDTSITEYHDNDDDGAGDLDGIVTAGTTSPLSREERSRAAADVARVFATTLLPDWAPTGLQASIDRLAAHLIELGVAPRATESSARTLLFTSECKEVDAGTLISSPTGDSWLRNIHADTAVGLADASMRLNEGVHARSIVTLGMIEDSVVMMRRTKALRKKLVEATALAFATAGRLALEKTASTLPSDIVPDQLVKLSRRRTVNDELWIIAPWVAAVGLLANTVAEYLGSCAGLSASIDDPYIARWTSVAAETRVATAAFIAIADCGLNQHAFVGTSDGAPFADILSRNVIGSPVITMAANSRLRAVDPLTTAQPTPSEFDDVNTANGTSARAPNIGEAANLMTSSTIAASAQSPWSTRRTGTTQQDGLQSGSTRSTLDSTEKLVLLCKHAPIVSDQMHGVTGPGLSQQNATPRRALDEPNLSPQQNASQRRPMDGRNLSRRHNAAQRQTIDEFPALGVVVAPAHHVTKPANPRPFGVSAPSASTEQTSTRVSRMKSAPALESMATEPLAAQRSAPPTESGSWFGSAGSAPWPRKASIAGAPTPPSLRDVMATQLEKASQPSHSRASAAAVVLQRPSNERLPIASLRPVSAQQSAVASLPLTHVQDEGTQRPVTLSLIDLIASSKIRQSPTPAPPQSVPAKFAAVGRSGNTALPLTDIQGEQLAAARRIASTRAIASSRRSPLATISAVPLSSTPWGLGAVTAREFSLSEPLESVLARDAEAADFAAAEAVVRNSEVVAELVAASTKRIHRPARSSATSRPDATQGSGTTPRSRRG